MVFGIPLLKPYTRNGLLWTQEAWNEVTSTKVTLDGERVEWNVVANMDATVGRKSSQSRLRI